MSPIRIASRGSALALEQGSIVRNLLLLSDPSADVVIVPMMSGGDLNKTSPLYLLGGTDKGLWTKEMEDALLAGQVDMIVHSLKDVATALPEGCVLGAICSRADSRDALVMKKGSEYKALRELPRGAVVGTSSVRRVAQLRRKYPHLAFSDMRGNIDTRVAKLDKPDSEYAALILAAAGLERMNRHDRITAYLDSDILMYAVGQGALGVEIRKGDTKTMEILKCLDDWQTEWACLSERALLRHLQGGCSVPVGVKTEYTEVTESPKRRMKLTLTGSLTSIPGTEYVQHCHTAFVSSAEEAEELGTSVAMHLASKGGQIILDEVDQLRQAKGDINVYKAHTALGEGSKLMNCPAVAASTEPQWLKGHPAMPQGSSAADCPAVKSMAAAAGKKE